MNSFESLFGKLLREMVWKEIADGIDAISMGNLKSFEDYKFHTGKINALRNVVAMCDEVQKKIDES